MKKILMITAVAVMAAFSVQAQGSEELAALQKQLNELSAKIAQLEKANAEKTAQVEQTAQIENANAAKIAQIEQDNAKKTWSLEQLQAEGKKNLAGSWANDIKLSGDIRARYENREVSDNVNKDRQRIRLRVGAAGKVNDFTDFGVRLATGGTRTSSNSDLGDTSTPAAGMKSIWLDQAFVDMHTATNSANLTHLFLGKMPQPWNTYNTGLIWDTDLNPEGAAVTYERQFVPVKLKANAGTFVMRENLTHDIQLWSGQVAIERKMFTDHVLTLGMSDYYFDNANTANTNNSLTQVVGAGRNTPNTKFDLVEGFGSYGFNVYKLPVLLVGQYVVNASANDNNVAYLGGITFGKAKDKGTWEIGYNYRTIQKDAVVAGLNDSDFAGETWTDCSGHVFKGKYQVSKNLSADLAYILSNDYLNRDANTLQADLNFKF